MSGNVTIAVGSPKVFKVGSTVAFFEKNFKENGVVASGVQTDTGVSTLPRSREETVTGAITRSRTSLEQSKGAHFGIGLEGGIFTDESGKTFVFEAAAITIRTGNPYTETGESDPFEIPSELVSLTEDGTELNEATRRYLLTKRMKVSIDDIKRNGTSYYLSDGQISRDFLMQQALERAEQKLQKGLGGIGANTKIGARD